MVNMGVWIGPVVNSKDHRQMIIVEKTLKSIIVSGNDGRRRMRTWRGQ
jgi:hypothetical protein